MSTPALVIGSGPAGMATALALMESGLQVTMLDAGIVLESVVEDFTRGLSLLPHRQWSEAERESLKVSADKPIGGLFFKKIFNSDYPYRETDIHLNPQIKNAETWASLAKGGFSNVWGSAMMPYHPDDMSGWCIRADELEPHYRRVLSEVPVAAVRDDLEELFPIQKDSFHPLRKSRQAETLYLNMERHRKALGERHIRFGHSRLAVEADPKSSKGGCRYCSMCLYGCPYGLIYTTAESIDRWVSEGRLDYKGDHVVHRLREEGEEVVVEGVGRRDGQAFSLKAGRVYLATGPLSSARIMLESMGRYDSPVKMLDSQYFLFPYLQLKAAKGIMKEDLSTLCQMFLEINDPAVTEEFVHLQVYSYSDLFLRLIRQKSGPLFPLVSPFLPAFLNRMLLVQGYLHSRHSGHLLLSLGKSSGEKPGVLKVEGVRNPETSRIVSRVMRKLGSVSEMTGAYPMRPGMQITLPGRGFHSGGTFPMVEEPKSGQSDRWGRPKGFQRVHLTDSSVLPEIPATTITLAMMANAHRIASHHKNY